MQVSSDEHAAVGRESHARLGPQRMDVLLVVDRDPAARAPAATQSREVGASVARSDVAVTERRVGRAAGGAGSVQTSSQSMPALGSSAAQSVWQLMRARTCAIVRRNAIVRASLRLR